MKQKSELFNKGFSPVRAKLSSGSKYLISCYNCDWYYKSKNDTEEVCQNPEVLKYDMVVTETSIYCSKWVMTKRTDNSVKKLYKKNRK